MDHRIQVVCAEVESYPGRSLRIAELSQSVNLSSSRLRHLFRSKTGQSLAHFRNGVRLQEARALLATTFLSVKQVMHRVGVGSDSHFAHDFKEACGLSPTQYRAQSKRTDYKGPK